MPMATASLQLSFPTAAKRSPHRYGVTTPPMCRRSWRSPPATISFLHRGAPAATSKPEYLNELFSSLESWATDEMLPLLKPVAGCWQPDDLLPEPESPDFLSKVSDLRETASAIPDELFVCLVGNMVTEEALPTYHAALRTFDGVGGGKAWAEWAKGWSAEENRHGDVLNRYLYLCGRVDMKRVEVTVHHLIKSGMEIPPCPFRGFIYTSFQERATFISHGNTARLAREAGDGALGRICGAIAADEKRHELAYTKLVEKLLEVDPESTVVAMAELMRARVTMPGALMYDEQDGDLFRNYALAAQAAGVYTAADYADVVDYFVERWDVERLSAGLSGEGRKARDYVCDMPRRVRKMAELHKMAGGGGGRRREVHFSWVFNRSISVPNC